MALDLRSRHTDSTATTRSLREPVTMHFARLLALGLMIVCFPVLAVGDNGPKVCEHTFTDAECIESSPNNGTRDRLSGLPMTLSEQRCDVVRLRDWYAEHSKLPWLMFRIVGVLTILLSVAVPYLGTLEGKWRSVVLPLATLAIAALTGMTAFFQWQTQWAGFRGTELKLRFALAQWNIAIAEACAGNEAASTSKLAIDATRSLIEKAETAVSSETGSYFAVVEKPDLTTRTSP